MLEKVEGSIVSLQMSYLCYNFIFRKHKKTCSSSRAALIQPVRISTDCVASTIL